MTLFGTMRKEDKDGILHKPQIRRHNICNEDNIFYKKCNHARVLNGLKEILVSTLIEMDSSSREKQTHPIILFHVKQQKPRMLAFRIIPTSFLLPNGHLKRNDYISGAHISHRIYFSNFLIARRWQSRNWNMCSRPVHCVREKPPQRLA